MYIVNLNEVYNIFISMTCLPWNNKRLFKIWYKTSWISFCFYYKTDNLKNMHWWNKCVYCCIFEGFYGHIIPKVLINIYIYMYLKDCSEGENGEESVAISINTVEKLWRTWLLWNQIHINDRDPSICDNCIFQWIIDSNNVNRPII